MASFRDFAATNAPGTCLWCGRKLKRKAHVDRETSDEKPRKCYARITDYMSTAPDRTCGSTKISLRGDGYYCENNHHVSRPRKVVNREYVHDKPGDYGDGHFCNLSCGYKFGRAMADNGRRLQPKKGDGKQKTGESSGG